MTRTLAGANISEMTHNPLKVSQGWLVEVAVLGDEVGDNPPLG